MNPLHHYPSQILLGFIGPRIGAIGCGLALAAYLPAVLALAFWLRTDEPIWAAIAAAYRNGGL